MQRLARGSPGREQVPPADPIAIPASLTIAALFAEVYAHPADDGGKPVFRRGFLAAATVSLGQGLGEAPACATLEELWFWGGGPTPAMRHARVFHHPPQRGLLEEGLDWAVEELEDIAISPDGSTVAVAHDHGVILLDAATGNIEAQLP